MNEKHYRVVFLGGGLLSLAVDANHLLDMTAILVWVTGWLVFITAHRMFTAFRKVAVN